MRRVAAILIVCLLPACRKDPPVPTDPYLADLRDRLARLQPEVEREIGRKLGHVEIVVLPRERIVDAEIPQLRELLVRIENGPRGDEIDAEARAWAEGSADWALATVDGRSRILLPEPNVDMPELLWLDTLPGLEFDRDPRALDLLVVHELVHVHQQRHLTPAGFREAVRSRADIMARAAVLEGHAEYLTRTILGRIGLGDLYEKYMAERDRPGSKERFFAYVQGREFVDAIVGKLGYEEAIRRIFASPPTLAAVCEPEHYSRENESSRWAPITEDLRRWLARERGPATLGAIALPTAGEFAGDAAVGFREGFRLGAKHPNAGMFVMVAAGDAAAREFHLGWTRAIEEFHRRKLEKGMVTEVRLTREPDNWTLHAVEMDHHVRRNVIREGTLVLDVSCSDDSEVEQGAERLARRALRFLTDEPWRKAWLNGDERLLESGDPGLRLAAVSRLRRFVPDDDWEVRWLGRACEAGDESRGETDRTAALVAAIGDPHPAVVTRALLSAADLRLREIPWPLLREQLVHEEVAVRRAAWGLMDTAIAWSGDPPALWRAPRDEALPLVTSALDDGDVTVRAEAVECLVPLREEPGVADAFRKALADAHPRIRTDALITLSCWRINLPELLPDLIRLLPEDPEHAAGALGHLGDAAAPALGGLGDLLADKEGRVAAAKAIWKICGNPEPLFAIVREVPPDADAIKAAGELAAAARPLVPEIAKALRDERRWVRYNAAKALGEIGGFAARAALLGTVTTEADPTVREGMRNALETSVPPSPRDNMQALERILAEAGLDPEEFRAIQRDHAQSKAAAQR